MQRSAIMAVQNGAARVVNVHQGDCQVSSDPDVMFSTVLGSCVSACVRDRVTGAGGMNHFLLAGPGMAPRDMLGASARYGAFAMEQLINMVLTKGSGRRPELEIKIFGGGSIHGALKDIGGENVRFVRGFLSAEGYPIASEDVGGTFARRVMFSPSTGRAFVKRLNSAEGETVVRSEIQKARTQQQAPAPKDDIELF